MLIRASEATEVSIAGLPHRVERVPDLVRDRDALGEFCLVKGLIRLDEGLTVDLGEAAFVHEVTEALNVYLGLGLNHRQIVALSKGWHQVLRDNGLIFGAGRGG
ncbi:MAG: hypothetical protein RDU89_06945 [bacterium]|nr:hypothetical protein [bacterium]